jgi:hypothetical protein
MRSCGACAAEFAPVRQNAVLALANRRGSAQVAALTLYIIDNNRKSGLYDGAAMRIH